MVSALAEIGDATQLLATKLARRFGRPLPVLLGIAAAALINASVAAAAGAMLGRTLPPRAADLLLALSLLMIAGGALFRAKPRDTAKDWHLGAFGTSLLAFLILAFGDKGQLATAAFAARGHAPALVAAGAVAGTVIANVPAVLLGPEFGQLVPVVAIRRGVAGLLGVAGLWLGLSALLLV